MKVVFTGGATGGHFYPLIAIAESIRDIVREKSLVQPRLYFIAPSPFDEEALFENEIKYLNAPAGKMRRYASVLNFFDVFVTLWGYLVCLTILLRLYPDVVVSKGGFASVPTVLAAATLGIPIIVHESDSKPGRANILASHFATRIAISFDSAAAFFPEKTREKIARTGIPVRKELMYSDPEGARQYLALDSGVPTVLILGGSSGAERINEMILLGLPELVDVVNIIHQTGRDHFAGIEKTSELILEKSANKHRYHPFAFLNALSLRRAIGIADLIISRAGATAIAEISLWKKPAVLIPIPESISHDQRTNAYAYARSGAAVVLEEGNLTPHILVSEIKRITGDPALSKTMSERGAAFGNREAGKIIAEEIVSIGLSHEPKPKVT